MVKKKEPKGKSLAQKGRKHTVGAKAGPSGKRPLKGLLTRRSLESQTRKMLLFVSTGNTCRSPMAAAYFKRLLEERKIKHIEVRSAGVMTIPGLLATDESKLMLEPYGISLDKHRSQPLTEEIIHRADLILGMTPFHVQMALRMSDEARGKTFLFKEFTKTDPKGRPIPDPMGCTLEVYKKCFRQIKQACDRLIQMPEVMGKPAKAGRPTKKRSPQSERKSRSGKTTAAARSVSRSSGRSPASKKSSKPAKKAKSSGSGTTGDTEGRRRRRMK